MTANSSHPLPGFVVLGQGKAGTSLIFRLMQQNPNVAVSKPKELHYFSTNFDKGLDWYAGHFDPDPGPGILTGEVSPSYLTPTAVRRVADTLGPDTKVIFILRRPIEQAYSRYLQNICARQKGDSFHLNIAALVERQAKVLGAIRLAYDLFGADNVLPMFYELDIATDAPQYEKRILRFLGLPGQEYHDQLDGDGRVNSGIMPRFLYSGVEPLHLMTDGVEYKIPSRHLVFCGQSRNSQIFERPTRVNVALAMEQQSKWSTEVSESEYSALMQRLVLPFADSLQHTFGFNMDHWRIPPRRISYAMAPPPAQFRRCRHSRQNQVNLAGAAGLEPATYGFGDRRSTN